MILTITIQNRKMADDDQVTLQSQDGQDFKVEVRVANTSKTVKNLIEDAGVDNPIPLPNVNGKILSKVVEYAKYHVENPAMENGKDNNSENPDSEVDEWDKNFLKVDQSTLFDLILAANYLDMADLLDLTCKTVANMIKGKTSDEIRKTFNITNDFSPEEEEQVRKENEWAEEK